MVFYQKVKVIYFSLFSTVFFICKQKLQGQRANELYGFTMCILETLYWNVRELTAKISNSHDYVNTHTLDHVNIPKRHQSNVKTPKQ